MINELEARKLYEARVREIEREREHNILIKFALKAKEQLKLFAPLRKVRR
ncbi:MAG: hypothetical protein RLP44_00725 [Aggregatilineales bacterium]